MCRLLKNGYQNWAQCRNLGDPIDGGEVDGIMAASVKMDEDEGVDQDKAKSVAF